jgi:carboxyl-terminal processing protease
MAFSRLLAWCSTAVLATIAFAGAPPAASAPATALAKPDAYDTQIVNGVSRLIEMAHLKQHKIDVETSRRMHRLFIEGWDPKKLFFLESDINEFAAAESKHAEFLNAGDLAFPVNVYQRYLQRVVERNDWAQSLADEKYDFTKEDSITVDNKTAQYCKTNDEAKERWRSWIKYELCGMIVDGVKEKDARERIKKRYRNLVRFTKQIDKDELLERYLVALTTSYDPHSTYMSPKSQEEFEIAMRLKLQGIGALLSGEDGRTVIKEIIPGGAAEQDKRLKVGDRITGVGQGDDGEIVDVDEMKLGNVVKMIRGEAGTRVKLEVIPANSEQRVVYVLTRQQVQLTDRAAKGEVIETPQSAAPDAPKVRIGVVKLPSFYADADAVRAGAPDARTATGDVRRILGEFQQKGVDAVVMDLRENGGGLLSEAISLTGLFIDEGPVVQVKDWNSKIRQHPDDIPGVVYDGPLVVLVSKFSASASEIFAGAIQDYHRGLVVGDSSTHGKGSVQQIVDLAQKGRQRFMIADNQNLGALKITLQMFYRVNGDSTQNRGVVSDVILPSVTDREEFSESKLDYALEFDRIPPAKFGTMSAVTPDLVEKVRTSSLERRKKSEEFAKLERRVARFRELASRKTITFNQERLKAQKAERKELADFALEDDEDEDAPIKSKTDKKKVEKKFGANTYDKEVLAVAADYVRFAKPQSAAQRR